MTIEEIRELKKKHGISNAKLSDWSGVPVGTVNKVLSGQTENPRYDTLVALARPLLEMERREQEERERREQDKHRTVEYKYAHAPSNSLMREEALAYGVSPKKGPGDFTIDDYYALPDEHRVELIDGVFYDMAAPTTFHQRIALEMAFEITSYIRGKGGDCTPFISPVDVQIDPKDDKTMVQPDVLIVCDPSRIHSKNIIGAPDFILEVVSPSTSAKDYYRKSAKYEQSGVREYWIIDPIRKRLTIYYFESKEPVTVMPLQGKMGIGIYHNELEIDLDAIAALIPEDRS